MSSSSKTASYTLVAIALVLLLSIIQYVPRTEAAHARKRPTASSRSSSSNANKYDRQITTFDPNGRLLQVEYANECTRRGNTCAFLNWKNGEGDGDVIIAVMKRRSLTSGEEEFNGDSDNGGAADGDMAGVRRNRFSGVLGSSGLHRISDGILCKMTGLEGDGRLLARHLQGLSHQLAWTEGVVSSSSSLALSSPSSSSNEVPSVYVQQVARVCGEVQHSLTIRNGARPLGVDVVFMGKTTCKKLGLFHCTVGGVVNQCEFCACGKDSNLVLKELDALVDKYKNGNNITSTSMKNLKQNNYQKEDGEKLEKRYDNPPIRKLITDVSRIVLRPTAKATGRYAIHGDDEKSNGMVDVYVISMNPTCRGGIQISCALSVTDGDIEDAAKLFEEHYETS